MTKKSLYFISRVVKSGAEYLLDDEANDISRDCRYTYRDNAGWDGGNRTVDFNTRTRLGNKNSVSFCGYGLPLANNFPNNPITGFDDQFWTRAPQSSWAAYTRAEQTWYMRNPYDWQNSPYRMSLANAGNNSNMRPAGDTSADDTVLAGNSKGFTIINVTGNRRMLETEVGSSRTQFLKQETIYANNTVDAQYAIDEEMLPPNETGVYVPKVRIYGTDAVTYWNTQVNAYEGSNDPNGTLVVKDNDVANAPDLPKSIRDILATLPS